MIRKCAGVTMKFMIRLLASRSVEGKYSVLLFDVSKTVFFLFILKENMPVPLLPLGHEIESL